MKPPFHKLSLKSDRPLPRLPRSAAVWTSFRRMGQLLAISAMLFAAGCAAYAPARSGESIHRNLLYASPAGHDLRMDLYVPKSEMPAPVVIWIFGGSWKFGSKGYHVNVRDLSRHGIAVASIDYRLSQTAKYPAQLDDCRSALRWLQQNGAAYGIDAHRIGLSGESAGGHLAALLGMAEGAPTVRAVCALYPPTDLVRLGRRQATPGKFSNIEKLLGGPLEQNLARAADASPVNHVLATTPPFLLIHGGRDETVPLEQSQELQNRLRRAHVESRLIIQHETGFASTKARLTRSPAFSGSISPQPVRADSDLSGLCGIAP